MQRVLLIRPLEDALPMTLLLKSKKILYSHYPLFKPYYYPLPLLSKTQALIITSKNAIRAIEKYTYLKNFPLFAVGDKTAEFADEKGFRYVSSASGTSQDLIKLILEKAQKNKGILWHLCGEKITGNLVETLRSTGFQAEQEIVYKIHAVTNLPALLVLELEYQRISHVIFCSSRTTDIFISLLKKKYFEKKACEIICLCLSQDIENKASVLNWKKIWVSPKPNIYDLMGYFDDKKKNDV